ncbi:neutral and basic amino acid transport protein rBAT-like [Haliotis rufescens]|uniref:neutral and basic amino acid transport protein rBAT-like n=1 Tax=Haliotis rufescens TaxID=6454 RepID=UPI001EB00B98|nr:neutral and basic amino acid transport protein rBAT-like [Haliotis rufescens]
MSDENTNHDEKVPIKEADAVNAEIDLDDSKAKFLNGGKGMDESHVEIEVPSESNESFSGLGKDELMQYVNDPFWKRLRIILFVLFWVGWLAMLAAAIVIIVLAPRCPYRPDLKWYNKEAVYNAYPKSFKDSDGNGKGDLGGVQSKSSYITDAVGAKVISLGSIYKKDTGNGIIDHKDVDPTLGSIEQVDAMLASFKKSGVKIVLDFVPNHTSKNHTWFLESKKSKDNKFSDYYVWADVKNGGPPNNWKNVNGGPAWNLDSTRNQYYLCQTGPEYPDLNLENEDVVKEMTEVLKFWLSRGIGGFNLKDASLLVENLNTTNPDDDSTHVNYQGSIPVIQAFRATLNAYSDKPGRERVLYASIAGATKNQTMAYYGTADKPGLHIVVGNGLVSQLSASCNAACMKKVLDDELYEDNVNKWLGWMLSNGESSRVSQRMGVREVAAIVMQLMLPGTPIMYYGDEVGMKDGTFTTTAISGVSTDTMELSNMKYRTPMQWNAGPNAGFTASNSTPYLPINDGYKENNVASERAHFRKNSVFEKVDELMKLRGSESLQFGKTTTGIVSDMVYFVRKAEGFLGYLVAFNFGADPVSHLFKGDLFSETGTVMFHSHQETSQEKIDIGNTYLELRGGEAVIIQLDG